MDFAADGAVRSFSGYNWMYLVKWSLITKMCLLCLDVMGKSTKKSMERSSNETVGKAHVPILAFLLFCGFIWMHVLQFEMKFLTSLSNPGHQKFCKIYPILVMSLELRHIKFRDGQMLVVHL